MRARTNRLIAAIATLAIVAAACGGDDDDAADTTEAETETSAAPVETSAAPPGTTGDTEASSEFDLEGRTITIAVENAYLPFNYLDPETGEPTGWDYEVIDHICAEILNCVPQYETFPWDPMIQAVGDGQFDMAADGITITEEREEVVDFSEGYISVDQRLLVAADSELESLDDVVADDCNVTTQIGTTNFDTAIETFGEDRVVPQDDFGFVVQSVIAGDNCAAVIDETAGQGYVGANADAVKLVGEALSSDALGFIFPNESDLVEPFNYALNVMKQDGTLEEISAKYFGEGFTISYEDIPPPSYPSVPTVPGSAPGTDGEGAAIEGVELTIGYALPQTGALSGIIDALAKPIEMATEEINAAGGNLTVIPADDGTDPAIASTSVDGLINEGVSAILGPAATGVTLSVIDKITDSGIVQCSGSTTGSVFTTYDDGGFFFRTAPPDSLQGIVLADLITDDGASSVGIMYRDDAYGAGLSESLQTNLEANGLTVAANVAYNPDGGPYDAEIGEVSAANPDAVVLITFGEGAELAQGLIEAGMGPADLQWYVTDGFKDEVTVDEVDASNPALFEGIRGTAPSVAPPDGEPSFPDRFAEFAPDVPTIFSPHFYDCTMIIALAAQEAGTDDPAVFVEHMQTVTNEGTECTSWEDCASLIAEGEDIDYQGASGTVDLDANGEPTAGAYDVYTYDAEGAPQTDETVPVTAE